ncbi:MAG: RNA methyltransferase [Proteobacteria bacterium]|nr:RNA methyltransferase [Pseudomonadota bacterium]MBU1687274.1 RNA methyltransferase [Pseudomonadota bacterium]
MALIHYPVLNRKSEIIGSAVTNLDLHDIARAAKTYGVNTYYLVVPHLDQQSLVNDLLDHWLTGYGATYNTKRKEALGLIKVCDDLDCLYRKVTEKWGARPTVLATSAASGRQVVGYGEARKRIQRGHPHLLLFGTGWGLAPQVMDRIDGVLPPIQGGGEYNHLSVRSAVSIILDRLLGPGAE